MNKLKIIFWLLVANIIFSFFLLKTIGEKLNPIITRYVNIETNRFANNIVNSMINETIVKNYDPDLFIIKKDSLGQIETLDYDTQKVNKLLLEITNKIQDKLLNLEEGKIEELEISNNFKLKNLTKIKKGVLCEVPLGALKGNSLFANIGPNIPIRLSFIGQVQSNLETKISSYGINNIIVETNIVVEVEEQVTMPTTSKKSTLIIKAPLTIKIIKGETPNYYSSSIEKKSSSISLPLE
ncbi:MAG: sporulation protein YunB [bacterium]|nr:sporulation protein YunB [bacterium]